jgi:PleD family two-component response regulator
MSYRGPGAIWREALEYRKNILLISDRTPIFAELASLLAGAGYRITLAFYGQEAFMAVTSGDFPLVISHLSKDWADKGPFLEAVRKPNREISLLFLRLDPDFGAVSQAFHVKTDGRDFRPQGWGRLRHLVTECLSDRQPRSESAGRQVAPVPVSQEGLPEKTGSLLKFRRKSHAPRPHPINQ